MDQPPWVLSLGQPGAAADVSAPPIRAESGVGEIGGVPTVVSGLGGIAVVSMLGRTVSAGIFPTVSMAVVSGLTRTVAPVSVSLTRPLVVSSMSSSVFRAQASEIANAPMSA
ncbi:MAG TPA: hypothetical protein VFM14_13720 [Gemmatimonadales bacterium]|nr:hypothetical protein [Gemmatimonadales bacterium]